MTDVSAYYASLMAAELSRGVYITSLLANLLLIDKEISIVFQKIANAEAHNFGQAENFYLHDPSMSNVSNNQNHLIGDVIYV